MELEVTWKRLLRIWWAWLWRSLLATAAAWVMSFFGGLWLGALTRWLALPVELATTLALALGFLLGLVMTVFPLWQIVGRNFGDFRLVLLARR